MYRVKYINKNTQELVYRCYKYVDSFQLQKIIYRYSVAHNLIHVSTVKEY